MTSRAKAPSRLLLTVAFAISALLLGIIAAVAAGTGTVTPPPKIAFVTTNANVAPDALTVGPMAGRLGAPLFITNGDTLGESTKDALVAYGADLIIVAGGPNTVSDGVLAQISAATGKEIKDIADTPSDGIVRVAGAGRDETAVALSELIAAYNPKFLPTDATAADSDLLDGKDSTDFMPADGTYASPQVRTWSTPGAAFRPAHSGQPHTLYTSGMSGVSGPSPLYAPLELPDGARITRVAWGIWDADAANDLEARLVRVAQPTVTFERTTVASAQSSGQPLSTMISTNTNEVVDNTSYTYFLEVVPVSNWTTDMIIISGQVTYTVTSAS